MLASLAYSFLNGWLADFGSSRSLCWWVGVEPIVEL
ncbi:hypothetical protein NPIL_696901, partial [Nephila pilipes]